MIYIPIGILKEWYLMNCRKHLDETATIMWGKEVYTEDIAPTLTGWIKYWRLYCKKENVKILYKNQIPF